MTQAITTEFDISKTHAASKLNVVIWVNPNNLDEFYIQRRYKTIGGEIKTNWLDYQHQLLDEEPNKEGFLSYVTV